MENNRKPFGLPSMSARGFLLARVKEHVYTFESCNPDRRALSEGIRAAFHVIEQAEGRRGLALAIRAFRRTLRAAWDKAESLDLRAMERREGLRPRYLRRADSLANVFADPRLHYLFGQRARILFPADVAWCATPRFAAECLRTFRAEVRAEVRRILSKVGGL